MDSLRPTRWTFFVQGPGSERLPGTSFSPLRIGAARAFTPFHSPAPQAHLRRSVRRGGHDGGAVVRRVGAVGRGGGRALHRSPASAHRAGKSPALDGRPARLARWWQPARHEGHGRGAWGAWGACACACAWVRAIGTSRAWSLPVPSGGRQQPGAVNALTPSLFLFSVPFFLPTTGPSRRPPPRPARRRGGRPGRPALRLRGPARRRRGGWVRGRPTV